MARKLNKEFSTIMKKLKKVVTPEYLDELTTFNAEAILKNEML